MATFAEQLATDMSVFCNTGEFAVAVTYVKRAGGQADGSAVITWTADLAAQDPGQAAVGTAVVSNALVAAAGSGDPGRGDHLIETATGGRIDVDQVVSHDSWAWRLAVSRVKRVGV